MCGLLATAASLRECLRDEPRAAILAQHRVRLPGVGHTVREEQRVLRGEHVVHEGPHGGLVRLRLPGGGGEDAREPEVLRLRARKKTKQKSDRPTEEGGEGSMQAWFTKQTGARLGGYV